MISLQDCRLIFSTTKVALSARTFNLLNWWVANASYAYTSGLYYKHVTIVNDDSNIINKFEASLTGDSRVVMYDHCMFIVQATAVFWMNVWWLPYLFWGGGAKCPMSGWLHNQGKQ